MKFLNGIIALTTLVILTIPAFVVYAQSNIQCGDVLEGEFVSNGETHEYLLDMNVNDRFIVYVERIDENYKELRMELGVVSPSDIIIDKLETNSGFYAPTVTTATKELPEVGSYTVSVRGLTNTGGLYKLYVGCIRSGGVIIGAENQFIAVQCGSIIENRFRYDGELHHYYLNLLQGDAVTVNIETGVKNYEDLKLELGITSPGGNIVDKLETNSGFYKPSQNAETLGLPESGTYEIAVRGLTGTGSDYAVYIKCNLVDGSEVNPGDTPPIRALPAATAPARSDLSSSSFSGIGFPGLAPVDFGNAFKLPLSLGTAMPGSIPSAGDAVLGLTFEANAGDRFALDFARTAGNLNLGLVVLSANNEVVFQASLVTLDTLSAGLTLPSAGQYTIGVFRIDLLPPAAPEATQFQITGTLNP